jgi:hypothetical protein
MGVALGRFDILVSQQFLHKGNIGASFQKMGRETMPQPVYTHVFIYFGLFQRIGKYLLCASHTVLLSILTLKKVFLGLVL